jgi:hypothetical protein
LLCPRVLPSGTLKDGVYDRPLPLMYRPLLLLCSLACAALTASQEAAAVPPCTLPTQEIPVRTTLASAGFFANLRGAEHSINSRMDVLLGEAKAAAHKTAEYPLPCPKACAKPVVAVIFTSSPNLSLQDYDEHSTCQSLYEATRTSPIVYAHRVFSSDQDAKEWYKDLTQGDGPDGANLYERCPGSCSPSYSSTTYRQEDQFVVTTSIVCGHARDKDDDQYRLTASLRWLCP